MPVRCRGVRAPSLLFLDGPQPTPRVRDGARALRATIEARPSLRRLVSGARSAEAGGLLGLARAGYLRGSPVG
jgi:hypothetical protein